LSINEQKDFKKLKEIRISSSRSLALFFENCLSHFCGGIFVCECFHGLLGLKKKINKNDETL
jgi:hypothetical protein